MSDEEGFGSDNEGFGRLPELVVRRRRALAESHPIILPCSPVTELPRPQPRDRRPTQGHNSLPISLRCNACATVIPKGTSLLFRQDYPKKPSDPPMYRIYINCTKCSGEMAIQRGLDRDPGYVAVVGATQYFEPVDEISKVSEEVPGNVMASTTFSDSSNN